MGQKSLIYAFVARGTVILAEYTEFSGNFNSIAFQCLQKLPATNSKFTYNCDGHTFNYLVDNGYTYCVVADESVGRQVPIAFLERAKDDFVAEYGGGKAATAAANSLNKEFGSKLKEHMQYCVDHPEEISKLAKVKAQVSEVKGVMMENIEKVLDRGEKIELLVDKTETLHHQAQDFRNVGTKMRRKMWLQNMKVRLREERGRSAGVRGRSRGRSAGPRARAESLDARAESLDARASVAGRGDHRRGRSLGRGRGGRRSQSRARYESPEGVSVLGAPWYTAKRTELAQAMKCARERKLMVEKEKEEGKYFGILMKGFEEAEAEGPVMPPPMEQNKHQEFWADPAAVIGCSASPKTDAGASPCSPQKTDGSASPDMFNFQKKQDLFD